MQWKFSLVLLMAASSLTGDYAWAARSIGAPRTPEPQLPPTYPVNLPGSSGAAGPAALAQLRCAAGAITCIEVTSTSNPAKPINQPSLRSTPITWGQPFKAGDWQPATQTLIAKVDDTAIALQMDEVSSHRDNSARFAVLSAQLMDLLPGQQRTVQLYAVNKPRFGSAALPPAALPDWNLEIEATVYDAEQRVISRLIARPQEQLKTQITQIAQGSQAAQAPVPRLRGPVATEYTVVTPFKNQATGQPHPHLSARLHVRLYDGGQRIRTDVVLENTRTWTPNPANITYALAIKRHGAILHQQPAFTHYHHARWHKVVWSGAAQPAYRLRHDMPYVMASRATWNYDLDLVVPEKVLAKSFTQLEDKRQVQEDLGPMGNVFLMPAFGTTGARADIGPLPEWTAYYLISQDERAEEIMLSNADAAGSVPIHYRDEETDQPLDVENHPNVSVLFGPSQPLLPTVTDKTIWSPDTAHQASFAYIPYLMTGDAFYLDEVIFWAAWNISSVNPKYRDYSAGLIRSNQVRAQAWALRSLGEAAMALPDTHPMKKYFQVRLNTNLNDFANNASESPLGIIHHHGDMNRIHPWQNDYVSIVLSLLAENNQPKAFEVLQGLSQFTVGRFLNESNGFCLAKAPGGAWKYRDEQGRYINTWKELFSLNYPSDTATTCQALTVTDGYPHLGVGYAASARAMLAAASNAGIPRAKSAYLQWKSMTPRMDEKLSQGPTWAIVPR